MWSIENTKTMVYPWRNFSSGEIPSPSDMRRRSWQMCSFCLYHLPTKKGFSFRLVQKKNSYYSMGQQTFAVEVCFKYSVYRDELSTFGCAIIYFCFLTQISGIPFSSYKHGSSVLYLSEISIPFRCGTN